MPDSTYEVDFTDMFGENVYLSYDGKTPSAYLSDRIFCTYRAVNQTVVFDYERDGISSLHIYKSLYRKKISFGLYITNADFGTFREWLSTVEEKDLDNVYGMVKTMLQYMTHLNTPEMLQFREYAVSWTVRTLRELIT